MAEATESEFDLRSLDNDELVKQMHDDLYDGLKDEIDEATHILLDRGWGPDKVLNDALVEGMRIVGIDFRDGILFVPEVLLSANAMKAGMEILRPLLAETGAEPIGKVVIGTVKGDIHDIGKNLVAMMLEGAGFEVIDLGINTRVDEVPRRARRAQARHPRHVGAAHHDDAVHEGRHRHAEGQEPARQVHRAGRRRAAERGVRRGDRRRRLLPRRRGRGRDRQAAGRSPSRPRGRPSRAVRTLVIACGALARELAALQARQRLRRVDVAYLPPQLHNRPSASCPRVRAKIREHRGESRASSSPTPTAARGGALDAVLAEEGVERIPGAHCYEFFAGTDGFAALHEAEPGTFYLTDFLRGTSSDW